LIRWWEESVIKSKLMYIKRKTKVIKVRVIVKNKRKNIFNGVTENACENRNK
jgi:hypothetical protein